VSRRTVVATALTLLVGVGCVTSAPAQQSPLDQFLKGIQDATRGSGGLGDVKIGQGLKEALRVGTENAVSLTGRLDGFFKNAAIKILLPDKLRNLEGPLRTVGFGPQVDDLVLSMNRAAERAAPAAREIFLDAIGEMTIDDARQILGGADTAATDYFKVKTTPKLTAAFGPVVERTMNEVGVTRRYNELLGQARALPFVNVEQYDLDHYVVGKSLDGLFHVVGEQEQKIRHDPAARVTDLLREVFGSR
jgi:uncharacterized protein DUF4197